MESTLTQSEKNSKAVCDALHSRMAHIVTTYDIKESTKRGYNRYAIAMYLGAVQEVCAELEANPNLETRKVIISHFNGRLCDAILRGLAFNPQTKDELRYGA